MPELRIAGLVDALRTRTHQSSALRWRQRRRLQDHVGNAVVVQQALPGLAAGVGIGVLACSLPTRRIPQQVVATLAKFGQGQVINVKNLSDDQDVTIKVQDGVVRTLSANFARLQKR